MRPLDAVRNSLDNWSDAELGALSAIMYKARAACVAANPADYSGDDLYDLARLCSLGQDWNTANAVALKYVAGGAEPHRAQAYALSVSCLVHINAIDLALATTREMMRKLPYDADVAYSVWYMRSYLERAFDPAALALSKEEHPAIVAALSAGAALKAAHGDAAITPGTLYQSAMGLVFLERYAGDTAGAAAAAAEIDAALAHAAALSGEDRQLVAAVRTQYGLLGARLPRIEIMKALRGPSAKPRINPFYGSATVLVLFPDWCPQCRKMMRAVTSFAVMHGQEQVHAYGLMFRENDDPGMATAQQKGVQPETPQELHAKEMIGTETLLVPAATAQSFGAIDFPFALVVGPDGRVEYAGTIPENAFADNGYLDQVLARIAENAAPAAAQTPRP
jgi:hypothetical protein